MRCGDPAISAGAYHRPIAGRSGKPPIGCKAPCQGSGSTGTTFCGWHGTHKQGERAAGPGTRPLQRETITLITITWWQVTEGLRMSQSKRIMLGGLASIAAV